MREGWITFWLSWLGLGNLLSVGVFIVECSVGTGSHDITRLLLTLVDVPFLIATIIKVWYGG